MRIGREAGLTLRLAPHKLRQTYATLSLRNGNNLEYVRITLGHTNIKTTRDAYLAPFQMDVAPANRRFSPMANLETAGNGKAIVLPNKVQTPVQKKHSEDQPIQKSHEGIPSEKIRLRNLKQEPPQKPVYGGSTGQREKTETGERLYLHNLI